MYFTHVRALVAKAPCAVDRAIDFLEANQHAFAPGEEIAFTQLRGVMTSAHTLPEVLARMSECSDATLHVYFACFFAHHRWVQRAPELLPCVFPLMQRALSALQVDGLFPLSSFDRFLGTCDPTAEVGSDPRVAEFVVFMHAEWGDEVGYCLAERGIGVPPTHLSNSLLALFAQLGMTLAQLSRGVFASALTAVCQERYVHTHLGAAQHSTVRALVDDCLAHCLHSATLAWDLLRSTILAPSWIARWGIPPTVPWLVTRVQEAAPHLPFLEADFAAVEEWTSAPAWAPCVARVRDLRRARIRTPRGPMCYPTWECAFAPHPEDPFGQGRRPHSLVWCLPFRGDA